MGLYDRLTFEEGLDVTFPETEFDPFDVTWQTKTLARHHPRMDTYKITADGRLFREDVEYETVPEEERPEYDEELEGFESPIKKFAGSRRKIHQGWSDTEYHGIFEFHASVEETYVSLEAKFTDGKLVEIRESE